MNTDRPSDVYSITGMVLLWRMVSEQLTEQLILNAFEKTRIRSVELIRALELEDVNAQPVVFVSPPKWHLAHTTWFFEEFILKNQPRYELFDQDHAFLFNSYYNAIGERVERDRRGAQTRPLLRSVLDYREHVDRHITGMLRSKAISHEDLTLVQLGLAHEEQHQELLLMDIKYILGQQYIQPPYSKHLSHLPARGVRNKGWIKIAEGMHEIGHEGSDFSFDNERPKHKVYTEGFEISNTLVTNGEYLEFISSNAYNDPKNWLDEGWSWKQHNQIKHPLYWKEDEGNWYEYKLSGKEDLNLDAPVCHVSFYEADAFASFKGLRLPTENEWEAASNMLDWGLRWEWTSSAYLPYPGFKVAEGAVGEYNGKFMVNQKVMRGSSEATPEGYSRSTYRNFFHPEMRWMFSGIRLVK